MYRILICSKGGEDLSLGLVESISRRKIVLAGKNYDPNKARFCVRNSIKNAFRHVEHPENGLYGLR